MNQILNDLKEEMEELRAAMDEISKNPNASELMVHIEERYHRVSALLRAMTNDE
jgi:hypothetical protein